MLTLGIETSCDDTCAALVRNEKTVLSNVTLSQSIHQRYQGVVPEVAARQHLSVLLGCIDAALLEAKVSLRDVDLIGVTRHPGLMGSLVVGMNVAEALGMALQKPAIPVNHLLGHLYSLRFENPLRFPLLGLIVSGGHTLLTVMHSYTKVKIIGSTMDDACGEAFDKVAKFFDLGYPGGAVIDAKAKHGDPNAFDFPVSRLSSRKDSYDFSYSGLKTAVLHHRKKYQKTSNPSLRDLLASFQRAAIEGLYTQTGRAAATLNLHQVGICGGVAANRYLRDRFAQNPNLTVHYPSPSYCTDNAAMIAGLSYVLYQENKAPNPSPPNPMIMSFKGQVGRSLH